jgi:hypothetical protein
MQAWYAERFEREMGCTEAEWLRWLPGAVGDRPVTRVPGAARVAIDGGALQMQWRVLPERRIALMRLPCLAVGFAFDGIDDASRQRFMRHFDRFTQRGGG